MNVRPAIVNVPVRSAPVLLAVTVNATVPFPVPLAPLVTVIQLASLTAVQTHPDCVITETDPVPLDLSSDEISSERQRSALRQRHRPPHETSGTVPDVLVDTDVFIDHLRGYRRFSKGADRVWYSVITRCELFAGAKVD